MTMIRLAHTKDIKVYSCKIDPNLVFGENKKITSEVSFPFINNVVSRIPKKEIPCSGHSYSVYQLVESASDGEIKNFFGDRLIQSFDEWLASFTSRVLSEIIYFKEGISYMEYVHVSGYFFKDIVVVEYRKQSGKWEFFCHDFKDQNRPADGGRRVFVPMTK